MLQLSGPHGHRHAEHLARAVNRARIVGQRLIFFAHPRSGSSSLYEILQSHPVLNIVEEPFNENFTRWDAANRNYLERVHDIPSLDAQVEEIFADHNGIKVLDDQLPADLAAHLLRCDDCKVLFLWRRNLLQTVVSVLLAEQTRLYGARWRSVPERAPAWPE